MKQDNKNRIDDGDDWDVITGTTEGGAIWRRYRDRKIVATGAGELPQEVLDREEERAALKATTPTYVRGDLVKVSSRCRI